MAIHKENKFQVFLSHLGFGGTPSAKLISIDSFSYVITQASGTASHQDVVVDYYYFASTQTLSEKHSQLWNSNSRSSFIAVFDNQTYIIDARQKPDFDQPISNRVVIRSFDYGINTPGYDIKKQLYIISKDGLDSSYYFDLVIEHQQRKKALEVDKDLLLNLLELRNDLVTQQNEQVIHLLLLRCLFVKYLEDRGVFENGFLHKTLSAQSPEKLISAFRKVRKINGDLFNIGELQAEDLQAKYLKKLSEFFGYTDYRSKQGKMFPYLFDKIPIQLVSSIYESFLKEKTKKDSGVYYTPSFLVNFILSQTLHKQLLSAPGTTVFDPACGSGAFLVEAFRMLIKSNKAEKDYEKKKKLLQTKLYGVDLDARALQIAAFSLYLALLEGEDPSFIREKIRIEAPILPSLIGKTLLKGNALTDDLEFEINGKKGHRTFDCIIANPPWGSTPDDDNPENIKIRTAIGHKEEAGSILTYRAVSDFQRSQAFLLQSSKWCHSATQVSMVVNNSIFLNENAAGFRKQFLENFRIATFYELSEINSILFKKQRLGVIKNDPVEIGANEPCCVVTYSKDSSVANEVKYIHPRQNRFTEHLRLIAYSGKEIIHVKQSDLIQEDMLWRIFVKGGWPDYQLIKKRMLDKDTAISIECRRGFQPKENMSALGKADWRWMIDINNFERYYLAKDILKKFNWNQGLHRKRDESIYEGERIIIPVRPLASHGLRFAGVRLTGQYVYKDNIHCIKIKRNGKYVSDYRPFLAILNSKFIGYYTHFISSQWGKGEAKRSTLRNVDIEKIPLPELDFDHPKVKELNGLVLKIEKRRANAQDAEDIEQQIDDVVFDLYKLTEYERALVNEFYAVNFSKKDQRLSATCMKAYIEKFSSVFHLVLDNDTSLSGQQNVSSQLGAVVSFNFKNKLQHASNTADDSLEIMQIVKKAQIKRSFFSAILAEEKVKYYDKEAGKFYIVKSNCYSDWTERQAIDDANQEIGDIINHLKRK